ncbi:MAG TPA: hypothetical protein VHO46_05845, partial [Bacteroidales bacterium]|nr:hypothetical protein [Bacteroidales bacterium]
MNLDLRSDILLQFFPESGKLIDGIETIVAYKSTDNQGIPREFTADIIDENKNIITHIVSDKHGTGKFSFLPRGNHIYRAVLTFSDSKYVYNLPVVEPEGYIINFNPYSSNLSLRNNQKMLNRKHYLMISVRGMVHSLSKINISNNLLQVNLPFKSYPKGIIQVTLLDSLFRPQAERLIFNNRPDRKMFVQIETDKSEYAKKEKVNLTIRVSDTEGNPVEASLSMSVIDAEKSDSLFNSPDIESYLYLASELKGRIDYNSFNLSDTTADSRLKTDLLMTTQGWRNFLWNSIRYRNTLNNSYSVEKGFFIDGILLQNGSRKSKGNYSINVLDYNSGFNEALKLDRTNRFEINIPLFYNSHVVLIQNRNKNNRIENLDFQIDTADYPAVGFRSNEIPYSHYNKNYFKALKREFAEADSLSGKDIKYINLPEVRIKAKSNYSYSTPNIELDLGKKDPTGKKYNNLFQMIYEEFGEKAFTGIGFNAKGHMYNPILVVDGRPYTASICPPCYSEDYHIAAEIPVETISDVKFYEAGSNFSKYLTPPPRPMTPPKDMFNPLDYLRSLPVVSLTTYSGSYRGNPKGALIFNYQGLYDAREFYKPVYMDLNNKTPDNRSTIYW